MFTFGAFGNSGTAYITKHMANITVIDTTEQYLLIPTLLIAEEFGGISSYEMTSRERPEWE